MRPIQLSTGEAPIVFIHYGNSAYLSYVFKCARLYNPNKQIILLGDSLNQHFAGKGIIHFQFADYMVSGLTNQFQKIFFILNEDTFRLKGKDDFYVEGKPGHFWQRFNWLRYFILYEFWNAHHFKALWTFDSDNMIVQDLGQIEPGLSDYDYCELHNKTSMQGLLQNKTALGEFCRSMISIFSNRALLENFKKELIGKPPGYTFTEMAAFREFQKNVSHRYLDGCEPFGGMVFDAVLSREQGFEMRAYHSPTLNTIKRVFFMNGNFYFKALHSSQMVQTVNIDCSWVPGYVFRTILGFAAKAGGIKECTELKFSESPRDRVSRFFRFYFRKLKEGLF